MDKKWVKVGQAPTWDYQKNKEIEGVFVGKRENVGANASTMYDLRMPDGSLTAIWGTELLDNRFRGITVGEEVRIEYLGKAKSPKSGREYHNFEVYHAQPEEIADTLGDIEI